LSTVKHRGKVYVKELNAVVTKYDNSIDRILNIEWNAIKTLIETLDRNVMALVIDLLMSVKPEGHKVITAGCGTMGTVARRVAHTLSVIEVPALYCSPSNSIHGGMGVIQKNDIVILFSKGGNTQEIINYIPVCKAKEAKIIAVTQNDASILATNSDVYLKIQVDTEADKWNMCASASGNAVAAVFDAIAFTIMEFNGFTKEDLMLTHSGGGLGERLKTIGNGR